MLVVKAALGYFALVFATGFVLGPLRIVLLVPRLGERYAELLELPLMLTACYYAARWICRRFAVPAQSGPRLALGSLALALLLIAEFSLVLTLRGIGIQQYLATRDPVSGAAYYLSLLVFALFPRLLLRYR